jgi:hypothetical protein
MRQIGEQRLRVYLEEGKHLRRIFDQCSTRTKPTIRTRWNMIQYCKCGLSGCNVAKSGCDLVVPKIYGAAPDL